MKIWINAGHFCNPERCDPGHVQVGRLAENVLTMQIRDKLVGMLETAVFISDDLDLRKSIDFVNERAGPDDLAVDIHLNAHSIPDVSGTEAFYAFGNDKRVAEVFSRNVSQSLGIKNRGAIPDSRSFLGALAWVRQLKCKSVIIECAYMTNAMDMAAFTPEKAALGIKNAIDELRGVSLKVEEEYRGILLSMLAQVNVLWKALQDYLKRRT